MLELHIPKAVNFAACEFCILSYGGLEFHSRLKMAKGQAGKTTRIPGILTNFIVVDDDYAGADLYEDDGLALARATGLIQAGLDVKFVRESDLIKAHNDPGAPPSKVEIKIPTFLDHPDSIELAGASVVFSGKFPLGGKTAMQKQVREMGGKCATKTHTGCTHMVIGSEAKDGWKYGDFGVQIYEALTLKYLGHPIQIIREEDWLKASKK